MGSKYKEGKKEALDKAAPEKDKKNKKRLFEFPSNVKQIGGLNKGLKIYIEDYAYTYISKLGTKTGNKDTAAFLVGFTTQELGEEILVILGAVTPPFSTTPIDGQAFSESDWSYARGIADKYFNGLKIVGWARSQPGYGLYLSAADISCHYLGFPEKHNVLLLCDPEEKLDCFFMWNENQDDIIEVPGYFIYYDKNHEMNAYVSESCKKEPEEQVEELEAVEVVREEEFRDDENAIHRSVDKAQRIADVQRQKRIISMMTSVSILLFFACVIMIIGLLQSGERISAVEGQLREMRTGYNNVVARLNDTVFPAFAAQQGSIATSEAEASESPFVTEVVSGGSNASAAVEEVNAGLDAALGISVAEETVDATVAESVPDTEEPSVESRQPQENTVYVVRQGDTLSRISQAFYGTTSNIGAIMDANGITDPDRLMTGMKLIIP